MSNELQDIRSRAEAKYYKIQTDIIRHQADRGQELKTIQGDQKTWEFWLGAISFSLAAISGVVLASPLSNYWALLATAVFLSTGISVAITTKKRIEEKGLEFMNNDDTIVALLVKERDIVWEIYMNPEQRADLNPIINQINLEKMRNERTYNQAGLEQMEKKGIDYMGDIWLGCLSTAVYILIVPTLNSFLVSTGLPDELIPLAITIPWLISIFALAVDAVRTGTLGRAQLKSVVAQGKKEIEESDEFEQKFRTRAELPYNK